MSSSDERAQRAEDGAAKLQKMVVRAKAMKDQGHSNSEIADAMGITESYVRNLISPDINWRQNCLTTGIHDGRPEKIWNLPLLQTTYMFSPVQLQQLVVDRIYNDAMEMVKHGNPERFTHTWADKVKELAAPRVLPVYQNKVGEITTYYRSPEFKRDIDAVVDRNKQGKLNPFYEPLHGHDTLNLLCRIVGTSADRRAVAELEKS